jgi:Protein of unknown function (DUF2911)
MRVFILVLTVLTALSLSALAQDPETAYCNFDDGNQVSVQYSPKVSEPPHNGKVWSPGATLYVQTPLTLGNASIGLGAYSLHFVPEKKSWTIIVNKNVTAGAAYSSAQDVARASMEVGELPQTVKELKLSFGHMAAKDCSLRVYYEKTGAFAEFMEK